MTISHSKQAIDVYNPNNPNSSILYTWLSTHVHENIVDKLNPEIRDVHDTMLSKIFNVSNERDFTIYLRDYKIGLLRWIQES